MEISRQLSLNKAKEIIMEKISKMTGRRLSLFQKRLLINMAILPTFNHISVAFGPQPEFSKWYEDTIVQALWYTNNKGILKRGRFFLIARKRLFASYTLGGLKLIPGDIMAHGLILNFFKKQMEGGGSPLLFTVFTSLFDQFQYPSFETMVNVYGPQIWREAGRRLGFHSYFLKIACCSMAKLLEANEQNTNGWQLSALAGHSIGQGLLMISRNEQEILAENGINVVQDLFGTNELTGKLQPSCERDYSHLNGVSNFLIGKCKRIRKEYASQGGEFYPKVGPLSAVFKDIKLSKLFRDLMRAQVDNEFEAPPSFLTRRKEGYALPNLSDYMEGFNNILYADAPSTCKELGFLIMNRQVWTSVKQSATETFRGTEGNSSCLLCTENENTFHLLLECEAYAFKIWAFFEQAVNTALARDNDISPKRIRLGAFQILYGQKIVGVNNTWDKVLRRCVLHTIKWIYCKRTLRLTGVISAAVRLTDQKILGHLILIQERIISLLQFQGKSTTRHELLKEILVDML